MQCARQRRPQCALSQSVVARGRSRHPSGLGCFLTDPVIREIAAHAARAIDGLDWDDAEKHLRATILRIEELALTHAREGREALVELAAVLARQRRFPEADAILDGLIRTVAAHDGSRSIAAGEVHYARAEIALAREDAAGARRSLAAAIGIARSQDGAVAPPTAAQIADRAAKRLLGLCYRRAGWLDWAGGGSPLPAARSLAFAADAIRETFGPTHPLWISLAIHPAMALILLDRPTAADAFDRALAAFFDPARPAGDGAIGMLLEGRATDAERTLADLRAASRPAENAAIIALHAAARFACFRDLEAHAAWACAERARAIRAN